MRTTNGYTPRQLRLATYTNAELQQVLEGFDPRLDAEVSGLARDDARSELERRGPHAVPA